MEGAPPQQPGGRAPGIMQPAPQQPAWQAKKEAWLKLADEEAQAAVSRLGSNEQRHFWMQAPDDFQHARNPSALLYRLSTTWWRWHCRR